MKLDLYNLLTERNILFDLKAATAEEAIGQIVSHLAGSGLLKDAEAARQAVLVRERRMPTGLEKGVAVPHGKTDSVDALVAAIAVAPEGVDFGASDREPARILVLTVSPASRSGPHIQFLAEITRLLRSAATRRRILEAGSAEQVREALR